MLEKENSTLRRLLSETLASNSEIAEQIRWVASENQNMGTSAELMEAQVCGISCLPLPLGYYWQLVLASRRLACCS